MIHSINSDHSKFKKIEFHSGFNMILAERTEKSSQKDSRNGPGKSTMINIIHFCLGGSAKDALNNPKLNDSMFTLDLDLNGKRCKVSRSPGNKNQIFIDGDYSDWSIKPKIDADRGMMFLRKDSWQSILGKLTFDLPIGLPNFHPTFRSMISYFIRKHEGFLDAFKQSSSQQVWDIQTNNAYLLDLGWKFATDLQILRQEKTDLDAFNREIKKGTFAGFMGNAGKLKAEQIRLQVEATRQRRELDRFQINEQYEQIEKEANDLTDTIHNNINQNVVKNQSLNKYNASIKEEQVTDINSLSEIYRKAGFYFPEKIIKTLDQVNDFHNKIIKNRKEFLKAEIQRLEDEITQRAQTIKQLDKKRADLMQILNTQGALKEYMEIQKNYNDSQSELNDIKAKLENLKNIDAKDNQIKIDKQKLYQNAQIDLKERTEQQNNAITIFGEFSRSLYNEFGALLIDVKTSGFIFGIDIPRSSSQGIGNMKVFCYDMTLAKIWSKKNNSPGFLIHDSVIFDGVDKRQRAGALILARDMSEKEGFQYICTLNSDMIPHVDLGENFDLNKYVVRTLTDDGGLLGMRI